MDILTLQLLEHHQNWENTKSLHNLYLAFTKENCEKYGEIYTDFEIFKQTWIAGWYIFPALDIIKKFYTTT